MSLFYRISSFFLNLQNFFLKKNRIYERFVVVLPKYKSTCFRKQNEVSSRRKQLFLLCLFYERPKCFFTFNKRKKNYSSFLVILSFEFEKIWRYGQIFYEHDHTCFCNTTLSSRNQTPSVPENVSA